MLTPFTSRYAVVDGIPLHVADFGGSGPPVVCVHGLGGSHINWVSVAGGLGRLGRVSALDLPGFGFSPATRRTSSMEALRRTLECYLRSLEEPALLVANSMGGTVSLLQAAAAPETVRGLVLVSPAVPRAPGVWPDSEVTALFSLYLVPGLARSAVAARRTRMTPEEIARWTLDLCSPRAARIPPDVVKAHVDVAIRRSRFAGADRALVRTARSMLTSIAKANDFDKVVATVAAPTLVVQGRDDRLVRHHSVARLAALRPDWDVRILDDVGHIAMLEVPATFVETVGEWAGQRAAA